MAKKTKVEKQELENLENQLKKVLADYQNLERRVERERKETVLRANRDLVLRLLPVLDTLKLAEKHISDEGLSLSIRQFEEALEAEGVERIVTEGREFDPRFMEGVELTDGERNIVVDEVRAGYTIYDEVLRPAQVKVGKGE